MFLCLFQRLGFDARLLWREEERGGGVGMCTPAVCLCACAVIRWGQSVAEGYKRQKDNSFGYFQHWGKFC